MPIVSYASPRIVPSAELVSKSILALAIELRSLHHVAQGQLLIANDLAVSNRMKLE